MEGFPDMSPETFTDWICHKFKKHPSGIVNRIQFEYVEPK
jgi:hypothetical protein